MHMDDAARGAADATDHSPAGHPAESEAPQLRTILLTDICDSIALVERLGDGSAATFFREHDRLVLTLQQQWRGRLIDRSDGLLLLFERPIDGLGFALDYARGLAEMGRVRNLELRSRAGLHVGEVLTWRNSDESVRVGSKPVEVEGLAKPIAARLMSMALPGQILLSAIAEPLAHRAARELGERGQSLIWKPLGHWRFKGVPEPQEIFEVGEPGFAPLRAPPSGPKAWRDVPLWRRPLALAAQAAVLAVICIGAWFTTRPAPAIAFNERDWVVVADLRNMTDQPLLDESLEQAFRISLEQSRFVNVLSDLKARDTLARMQLPPDTQLDRAVASELAVRDGARAVILPTVSEVGGRLRVSAEVIDPHTQTTVYAESADGTGVGSALTSIDVLTAALRKDLGEAVAAIESDSASLPEVTTKSLDALRAYALAQAAYNKHRYAEALQLYQRATDFDPDFALAWLGQVRVHYAEGDPAGGLAASLKAKDLKSHLPAREALYLDAWTSDVDAPEETTGRWVELSRLYPDYFPARGNAAIWLYQENRFAEALVHAHAAAVPQNPILEQEYDSIGRAELGMERYPQAEAAFARSYANTGGSLRRLAATAAAQRDFAGASAHVRGLETDNPFAFIEQVSIAVDQGQWRQAQSHSQTALRLLDTEGAASRYLLVPAAVADWLAGEREMALDRLRQAIAQSSAALAASPTADAKEDASVLIAAALVATRLGESGLAKAATGVAKRYPRLLQVPQVKELLAVVEAEQRRLAGDPASAVRLLEPFLSGHERYQTHVVLLESHAALGNMEEALRHARWLQRRRGLAYIELECGHCLQALNIADSNIAILREAELLDAMGRPDEAARKRADFDRLWPVEVQPAHLRKERTVFRPVSSRGVV